MQTQTQIRNTISTPDNSDTDTPPMLPAIAKDLAAYPGLAASWYILACSQDLNRAAKQHKPLAVKFNGKDLVVWRSGKGKIAVLDNYCSHMGASLSTGKITESGYVACPFHGWQYDGATGKCVEAPFVKHIPRTARQAVVMEHVTEKYGYIWGWYGTPEPLFELPVLEEFEQVISSTSSSSNAKEYRFWFKRSSMSVNVILRQILENTFDGPHFPFTHGLNLKGTSVETLPVQSPMQAQQVQVTTAGAGAGEDATNLIAILRNSSSILPYRATVKMQAERMPGLTGRIAQLIGMDVENVEMRVEAWPSFQVIRTYINGSFVMTTFNAASPVLVSKPTPTSSSSDEPGYDAEEPSSSIQYIMLMTPKSAGWFSYLMYAWQGSRTASQDIPLFNAMRPERGGAYTSNDRAILAYRRMYRHYARVAAAAARQS